ncbi:uncharacterized protein LOC108208025 isoform X2 [Daucus carota subsp. sativus]|uniref:uncharacterized protein LOC108208025 isoform X2 n=1 Tax=Daucus carota subsp. sativus TaxID=79200 RepID=UPI0007EF9D63|nr:PREDICTED: uncharacterized protein LOC108208025 isoform X2 [Daucus carota subsp. sativus]
MLSEKMVAGSGVYQKHGGEAGGDSILSGFGSSSGSSTDETCEREESLDELTRHITANMFMDDDEMEKGNQHIATLFQPTNVLENQEKKYYWRQKDVKEAGDGGGRAVAPDGSGMRAVFPAGSGSRKGSVGTGVFIPRVTDSPPNHHHRRKPGRGSRVIIPERVLQSLRQHRENRSANEASQAPPNENEEAPSKEVVNQSKMDEACDDEFHLPEEWIY